MDRLWSPWRYSYFGQQPQGCIFCQKPQQPDDAAFICYRGTLVYALLNLYPYTNGHLMVVPYRHAAKLSDYDEATRHELMDVTTLAQLVLDDVYHPDGINAGLNLGEAAGAGVAGHLHLHVLPRWFGDANFMTTVAETRVLPETLADTHAKLTAAFRRLAHQ